MKHLVRAFLIFTICGVTYAQSNGFLPKGEFPKTDFDNMSVDLGSILSGGPPRDGIPAIDKPTFISIEESAEWLGGQEPVVSFFEGDDARAYPLQILIYHEIVNDTVNNKPVTVTFCPLCNASIVFDRTIENEILDFGTTGRLRKSDLIMYDRQTESWWQQFTGMGIIGDYNAVELKQLPSQIVSFDTFRTNFPGGKVLDKETGFARPYGRNPYSGYDDINNNPFLFKGELDGRLPPMERVLSLSAEKNSSLLIPLSTLEKQTLINTNYNDTPIAVIASTTANSALDKSEIAESRLVPAAAAFDARVNGQTLTLKNANNQVVDEQTGSVWNAFGQAIEGKLKGQSMQQIDRGVHFAFAWLAFEPESDIYKAE